MSLSTLGHVLSHAESGGYAVGAFNVSDLNQAYAVMNAAHLERSPVIVQVIAGMHPYHDEGWWWDQLLNLISTYEELDVVLHLDHGRTIEDCKRAIQHGFSSVMIDASRDTDTDLPSSFEDNVAFTAAVAEYAHAHGVSVEGELGTIGGAEADMHGNDEEIVFADPELTAEFVRLTKVDALAVAVGTSHGSVKFTTPEQGQRLRLELIEKIHTQLPDTHLVLHGSSSIPSAAVETINKNGGALAESYGLDTMQKQLGITCGIRKINQGTDSHLAWTAALREHLSSKPSVVEPSAAIRAAMSAMSEIVALRMREFGSTGRGTNGTAAAAAGVQTSGTELD